MSTHEPTSTPAGIPLKTLVEELRRRCEIKELTALLAAVFTAAASAGSISPHPGFLWQAAAPFAGYEIEILGENGTSIDRDQIAHVARYAPAAPLEPGAYMLHVRSGGALLHEQAFTVEKPLQEIRISAGAGMAEIRAALQLSRERPSTRITFEPGTYRIDPGHERTLFEITDIQNLIVDGGGASFILQSIARVADVRDSRHVTLRNFSVDYDIPLHTAARVESVAADGVLELALLPGYAPPESVPRFMEEQRGLFYDGQSPHMAEGVPLLIEMKGPWEKTAESRYRLRAKSPGAVRAVRPGMIYLCAPRHEVQGFEIQHCEDITLADITTRGLPGIGVSSVFAEDLKLIRLRLLLRDDRLLAVQNGGTNLHNARIGPWVEGCRFENTGDDCNHINALAITPLRQPDDRTVVVARRLPGIMLARDDLELLVGDRLAFFNRSAGRLLAEARIAAVDSSSPQTHTLTMDRDLPQLVCGNPGKIAPLEPTQIFNLDAVAGRFVFRNNEFVRGRRTGILAKGGPGLIVGNRFEELGGGGVEIFNAPFEGLHGHDLLIRDNTFERGGLVHMKAGAAPAFRTHIFEGDPPQPLHANIRFLNNHISGYPGDAIHARDVTDLVIADNHFTATMDVKIRDAGAVAIRLENAHGAKLVGNRFDDPRYPKPVEIRQSTAVTGRDAGE